MEAQETPREYDFVCGLWCLSTALGRNVVVARPRAQVHLNMYVILVSESGILRKSSSIAAAMSIVRTYLQQSKTPMLLIESKITHGEMLSELSRHTREHGESKMVLVASELAAMLGRGTSVSGVPALLTDMYDCPAERVGGGSLHTGATHLSNVYANFIAGSTPSWLGTAVRPEIIAGGFTSRCFFVAGRSRKKLIAWPEERDDTAERAELVASLTGVVNESKSFPRIGITDTAKKSFAEWYGARATHRDIYRESFESREDGHVLRVAGLVAANEQQWQINDDHIRRAISVVKAWKQYGTELFTDTKADGSDTRLLRKLRGEILAAGNNGISQSALYRGLGLSGGRGVEMRSIISVLHELDMIKVTEEAQPRGRPKRMYYATEYLRNDLLLDEVARKLGVE